MNCERSHRKKNNNNYQLLEVDLRQDIITIAWYKLLKYQGDSGIGSNRTRLLSF
jgi:hypothetical protein